MSLQESIDHIKTIVKAATRLSEPGTSPDEEAYLNLNIGIACGNLSTRLIDFREQTIFEAEMLDAAKCLPSDAARAILTLSVQGAAHVFFSKDRHPAPGVVSIPEVDPGRDGPFDRIKALALTIDPETLLPKAGE